MRTVLHWSDHLNLFLKCLLTHLFLLLLYHLYRLQYDLMCMLFPFLLHLFHSLRRHICTLHSAPYALSWTFHQAFFNFQSLLFLQLSQFLLFPFLQNLIIAFQVMHKPIVRVNAIPCTFYFLFCCIVWLVPLLHYIRNNKRWWSRYSCVAVH